MNEKIPATASRLTVEERLYGDFLKALDKGDYASCEVLARCISLIIKTNRGQKTKE